MKKFVRNLLLLVLTLSLIVGVSGCRFIIDRGDDGDTPTEPTPQTPSQIIVETALPDSLTLAESVNLTTARTLQDAMSMEDAIESVRRSAVAISISPVGANYTGWGSGVLINTDTGNANEYYILTCHHVICDENADITVFVPDANYSYDNNNYEFTGKIGGNRTETQAVELVGGDAQSDVAVLKLRVLSSGISADIRANCLAPVMDPSNSLRVGEQVFAIGNSRGQLPGHTSTGTVSYINRQMSVEGRKMTLLEIDVNSYHGNSGGGLYNLYGELVGLTNSGYDDTIGINFAIPLKTNSSKSLDDGIVNIASQLIATTSSYNYGYISGRRLMLGFTVKEENSQVKVTEIDTSAPAYKAGLRLNDVITAVTYKEVDKDVTDEVKTNNDFSSVASRMKLLEEFTITVSRKSVREPFPITLKYTQQYFCNTGVYEGPVV